jgi:uncharacterized lipoprotein
MKKQYKYVVAAFIILISACNSAKEKGDIEKDDYQKVKESLAQKERKNPTNFLTIISKDKHNLIGQTVIHTTITNKAKVCVYKDVEIELSFISKTGVLLEKDKETVYETIEPGKNTDYKTKYFAPKGTDSVAIKIIAAKPV